MANVPGRVGVLCASCDVDTFPSDEEVLRDSCNNIKKMMTTPTKWN